jgi:hypothetical protein
MMIESTASPSSGDRLLNDRDPQRIGPAALAPTALYRHCTTDLPSFTTTAELEDVDAAIGQSRALAALE